MKFRCENRSAEEYFSDFDLMKKKIGKDFKGCYGINISGNIRLIVKPDVEILDPASLKKCDSVIIKGVMDYHGQKHEWLIP